MIQKIKRYILVTSASMMLFMPTIGITAVASAAGSGTPCAGVSSGIQEGANAATNASGDLNGGLTTGSGIDCGNTGVDNSAIKTIAAKITNTFSIIVGAASVIMIIYGGFRYITSGGESGRVGAAKNSLLYAIVGLVIVAIAQLIVHFVLNQASNLGT